MIYELECSIGKEKKKYRACGIKTSKRRYIKVNNLTFGDPSKCSENDDNMCKDLSFDKAYSVVRVEDLNRVLIFNDRGYLIQLHRNQYMPLEEISDDDDMF